MIYTVSSMAVLQVSDQSFEKEVLQGDVPVLVDFWAPWCTPCHMVSPVLEELSTEYEGKLKFVKLNVDENTDSPSRYSIMSIPTIIIFKSGEPKRTLIGVQSKDTFRKEIEEAL